MMRGVCVADFLVLVLLLVTFNFSVARIIVIIFSNILTRNTRQD